MSVRLTRRPARPISPLADQPTYVGDCPNRNCQATGYALVNGTQLPEHHRALRHGQPAQHCPCSGWQARNIRRDRSYVEGVRYL